MGRRSNIGSMSSGINKLNEDASQYLALELVII